MKASHPHDRSPNRHHTSRKQISLANRIIQRSRARRALARITRSVTGNANLHEDLLQGALLYLWKQLQRHPLHRWSWYLQRCYFHLKSEIRGGSSIDSPRHRALLDECTADPCGWEPSDPHAEENLLSLVSAQDIIGQLVQRLDTPERDLLPFLALGYGVREIARFLGLSHPAVIKRRRKIAFAARAIGISIKQ